MKHAAAWLLLFVVLWWLWVLIAGEWNRTQWIAAGGAAALGATLGELARTRADAHGAPTAALLAAVPSALAMVVVDFVVVMGALVGRKEGAFRTTKTAVAADERTRAWATYLATLSPNAYVVDVDPEREVALTHHLVVLPRSQDPV